MSHGVRCKQCGWPETVHDSNAIKPKHKYVPDKNDVRVKLNHLVEEFRPHDEDNRNKYDYYTKIVGRTFPKVEKKLAEYFSWLKEVPK